jgi:hypothetical protein
MRKKPRDHGICEALPAESRGDSVEPDAEVLRLKVRVAMDENARTAVRHALVQVGGVVSVTFEGTDRVVVRARIADLVHDHAFAENVCEAVEDKLLTLGAPRQQGRNSVVPEMRGYVDSSDDESIPYLDEPVLYLDDDEDGEGCVMARKLPDGSYWAQIAKLAKGTAVDPTDGSQGTAVETTDGSQASQRNASTDSSVQDCDEEPQYLDESEEEVAEVAQRLSSGYPSIIPRSTWSFFSQDMWKIHRRIQEYDSDPTLAARLQRAQLRRQKRQQEEQMRLGRVLSAMTPLRATTMSEAVKQCRQAAYEPRGVE